MTFYRIPKKKAVCKRKQKKYLSFLLFDSIFESAHKLQSVLEIQPDYKEAKATLADLLLTYGCHVVDFMANGELKFVFCI